MILTAGGLSPEDGGPSRSIPALAEALVRPGLEVEIITCESAQNRNPPLLPQVTLVKTHLLPRACRTAQWRAQTNGFTKALSASSQGIKDCVFHDNGLWLPTNHAAAFAAKRLKRPFIISPRGMLTAWALKFRGWKKRAAWWLFQKRDLQSAQILHATSQAEAMEFRALGLAQPIAVIPNGVEVPAQKVGSKNRKTEIRTILFLSRIHPKKGLLDLVEAWNKVRPEGWRVLIAGGDENGHSNEIKAEIKKLKIENDFEFAGEVPDVRKWDLYREADLFVLPTKSENFGIVIAEALACGVPVITTRGTPWEDLVRHGCGWWVELGVAPLAAALEEAIGLSDEARQAMGRCGRGLVGENYTWVAAADKMVDVYQWMLGKGVKPACVV